MFDRPTGIERFLQKTRVCQFITCYYPKLRWEARYDPTGKLSEVVSMLIDDINTASNYLKQMKDGLISANHGAFSIVASRSEKGKFRILCELTQFDTQLEYTHKPDGVHVKLKMIAEFFNDIFPRLPKWEVGRYQSDDICHLFCEDPNIYQEDDEEALIELNADYFYAAFQRYIIEKGLNPAVSLKFVEVLNYIIPTHFTHGVFATWTVTDKTFLLEQLFPIAEQHHREKHKKYNGAVTAAALSHLAVADVLNRIGFFMTKYEVRSGLAFTCRAALEAAKKK